jgi:Flp pilus assembly protein TadD
VRFSVSTAVVLVFFSVLPDPAMAAMGVPADSSDNQRPPELQRASPAEQSDYDVALRFIRHKQYADAIPHLQLALADKPQDTDILNYLGYAKRMVGDYDYSLYYYQRALAIDPNDRVVHENLGELYLAKSDLASAQKELATLQTLCPSGCAERDALTKAIANYNPTASPTPVAATAPTTTSPGGQP